MDRAPAAAPAPPLPAATGGATFQGAPWGQFHSRRFGLVIGFPDGSAWSIDDHRSEWLSATHEATRSKLRVRQWQEPDLMSRAACYARARGWDSELPDIDAPPLVDDRMRTLSGRFDARVVALVSPGKAPQGGLTGFAVVVGASVRKCLVIAYRTFEEQRDGVSVSEVVAERLATVSEGLVDSLRFDEIGAPPREAPASRTVRDASGSGLP